MFNRVQKKLQQDCDLSLQRKIIVGVSGGADSLCLLDILVRLNYPIIVAHFNHLLRPEASEDACAVELIAVQRGVPFTQGNAATHDYAQEHKLSIEEAARELRYKFLFEQAKKHSAQAVFVAHTADDQVETVLMHLLRGSGLDGLTGMPYRALPNPWSGTIPLMRPLLDIWRAEIVEYSTERGLIPRMDSTNTDTAYFRNRLRHELIPELESYVSGFRNRLWQTANLLAADRALLEDLTDLVWQEVHINSGSGYEIFNLESFNLQPLALRRRLLRKAIAHLRPGTRDVDFALVQRAFDFAEKPTLTGQADLGLGLRIAQENAQLIISDWQKDLPTAHWPQITKTEELPIPGELDLGDGWILRAEIPPDVEVGQSKSQENENPHQARLDLGERLQPLIVRPRRNGDRFQPLGMGGKSMKVSDFMINEKIPQRARMGWPLVCIGDEIAWVPGYRLAHPFRVAGPSRQIVRLFLLQKRSDFVLKF